MGAILSPARLRILKSARPLRDSTVEVVHTSMVGGFEAVTERRNIAFLVEQGLLEPSAHGDWYLTDAGREAVAKATHSTKGN